jgi:phage terminase small subunit
VALIQLHDEEVRLHEEGAVISGGNGFPKLNPRSTVVSQLSQRCMQLARHLRINPSSDGREAAKYFRGRQAEQDARDRLADIADDPFLPRQ